MVAKQQLASGSSTNAQRCSAGCSSGLWALGHGDVLGAVPASIVDLKHDAFVGPGADQVDVDMHRIVVAGRASIESERSARDAREVLVDNDGANGRGRDDVGHDAIS